MDSDQPKETQSRIPSFASVAEEAAFWDTHDMADFENELEPVDDIVFGSIRTPRELLLRLDGEILVRLDRIAAATGENSGSIARRWIEEGIHQEVERDPRLAN
jgi:hypothetical protein